VHALTKLLSGVSNVSANRIFHGTSQVEVYGSKVW
jgi:hypothetical protein